jgi:hypothetical protein
MLFIPTTLPSLFKLDWRAEFLSFCILGFGIAIFKNNFIRKIVTIFALIVLIIAIFVDPLFATQIDEFFGITNTVKTLRESIVVNAITIGGYFISFTLVRILVKFKIINEYL